MDSRTATQQIQPLPADPRALIAALNGLGIEPTTYAIPGDGRAIHLRRAAIHVSLGEGKLAFLEPVAGRVTGAVFSGSGHVIAIPPDPGERRSLARYVGVPILDQDFSAAYLRFGADTAAEIRRQMEAMGAKPSQDRGLDDVWAPVISRLNASQSLRIMADLLSTNPEPYFFAELAGGALGAFDVMLDPRREEPLLIGQYRTDAGRTYYDTWASFRPAAASEAGPAGDEARSFVPLAYSIETTIKPDLSLEGTTTLRLKAARAGERVLELQLSRELAVEGAEMEMAGNPDRISPVVVFQNPELSRRQALQRGNDAVWVVLAAPFAPGDEFELRIRYQGSVITSAGNGVEYVGDHGTWYANLGVGDFVPFDLTFRWPNQWVLVATGKKVESGADGEMETGRWVSEEPFARAGFNLGRYKMAEVGPSGTQTPEARDGSSGPALTIYANTELESAIAERLRAMNLPLPLPPRFGNGTAPALPYAPPPAPSPASVLEKLGGQMADSIRFFEGFNGAFPFQHLEVTQIPSPMAQSWPEMVYLSTLAFLPVSTQERAGIAEQAADESRKLMPFHEVAHQWWGNEAGAASYRDVWIEEGMAHYLAMLYDNSRDPSRHRLEYWLNRYRDELTAKSAETGGEAGDAGPLSLGYRLTSSKTPAAYPLIIYGKGAWVMHMIREMLREDYPDIRETGGRDSEAPLEKPDPDTRFKRFLEQVLADYRFRPLSTEDFEHELEREMTPAMDLDGSHSMRWFFDEWVRDTGIPRYQAEYRAVPAKDQGGFLILGRLAQAGLGPAFIERVPIYAMDRAGKLAFLGSVVTNGAETPFRFRARSRPRRLVIDPYRTLLCQTK